MGTSMDRIDLVVEAGLGSAAALALEALFRALERGGFSVGSDDPQMTIRVGSLADVSACDVLQAAGVSCQDVPESVAVAFADRTLAIVGSDERGLAYGVRDAARRIDGVSGPVDWSATFPAVSETPFLRKRSVCFFPHNEEMEARWYYNPEYWAAYFDKLSADRFNAFSLTFGHQTAYLVPPYSFLVAMPEFPEVSVPTLSDEHRERNLGALQMIARTATERGIDFTFGVWQQHSYEYGDSLVEGLTVDNLAAYCALGMTKVLQACPDIVGVQLRVNAESGIELNDSPEFFRELYAGIAAAGRPIEIDCRAKAIADDTWESAIATGLPTTVSTKFWCEHQGMPYHAGLLQDFDRVTRRHTYGDLLKYPRDHEFLFRLWNMGTNKFTLWADPTWVSEFARNCALGGSKGFEVCAPLSNKGFRNVGGFWPLFKPPELQWCEYEDERYWFWYRLFGRLGYDPSCGPEVWEQEFDERFGADAAPDVIRAVVENSHYLPFITAAHLPSASYFGWSPEMDTGGLIDFYIDIEPSDLAGFYGVGEYVRDYLAGTIRAKLSPEQIAERLEVHAAEALQALDRALRTVSEAGTAELQGVAADVRLCSGLAQYHAHKMRSALDLAFFYATGDVERLCTAKANIVKARDQWYAVVDHTDGLYADEMIWGIGSVGSGTWKQLTPYVEYDVARLDEVEQVFDRYGLFARGFDFGDEPKVTGAAWPRDFAKGIWVERRFEPVFPWTEYTTAGQHGWMAGRSHGSHGWNKPGSPGGQRPPMVVPHSPGAGSGKIGASSEERSSGVMGRDRDIGSLPQNLLLADFHSRGANAHYSEATFMADVPNGLYDITVMMGDTLADGVDRGPMWLTFQGRFQTDRFVIPAGQVVERTQRVRVGLGRLELEVNSHPSSDWVINAVVMREVAPHIAHVPIRAVSDGPLRIGATVMAPDGIREVRLHWRAVGEEFQEVQMDADGAVYSAQIEVAADSDAAYFIEAIDENDVVRMWPSDGAASPQSVSVGRLGAPLVVEVSQSTGAIPDTDLEVNARVESDESLAHVTLHYRDVNQRQLYTPVPMTQAEGVWTATIPGDQITADWDVMYYVEAMDRLGSGAIGPSMDAGAPYVVVPVERV